MMNEFEERVARAIATELPYALHIARNGWDSVDKDSVKYASVINAARAAIAAMCEPTAAMIEAGWPRTAMADPAKDLRTLTFTVAQLRDMILGAQFMSPPVSVSVAIRQIDIGLEQEWLQQQRTTPLPDGDRPC